jgi:hypothetical protein
MAKPLNEKRIARDLQKRAEKNRKIYAARREVEQRVLNLDIDWDHFYDRYAEECPDVAGERKCRGDHTVCRRVLREMLKDRDLVEDVLYYFLLQGGQCDCSVFLEVDMKDPRLLTDANCHDCGHDYDEYFMVRNDVWRASGLHRGLLCVGCLEGRIGRQLHQQDFKDVETNRPGTFPQSLRLRTRLRTPAPADEQSNLNQP